MSKQEVLSALTVIGPMVRTELDKYLGLKKSAVGAAIRYLRADKLVCIVDYTPSSWASPPVPIYGLGKEDKPWPKKPPRKEVQRVWRSANSKRIRAHKDRTPAGPWDMLL